MNIHQSTEFIGGHPALDFINTVEDTEKSRDKSRIADWESFCVWSIDSKIFNAVQLDWISKVTSSQKQNSMLNKAHSIREHAYRALVELIEAEEKNYDAIAPLKTELLLAMSRANLLVEQGQIYWRASLSNDHWLVDTLLLSIDDLMRSEDFKKMRQCGRCTWLFLDKGRGRGRRWCVMSKCGNREKTKRFRSQHPSS